MFKRYLENIVSNLITSLIVAVILAGILYSWGYVTEGGLVRLLGGDFIHWEDAKAGEIPPGAYEAGRYRDGQILYVCRVKADGGWHPGKIRYDFGGCSYPLHNKQHLGKTYQVLMR